MAKRTLNNHLVTYYEGKQLSTRTLERLKATIKVETKNERKSRTWFRFSIRPLKGSFFSPGVLAYLSVLFLLGYIALMVTDGSDRGGTHFDPSKAIAREIAMNHRKQLDVEFIAKKIPELQKQMGKLDFSLIKSDRFSKAFDIVGARYCSIQGGIAAQIQLVDSAGRYYTLYQTRLEAPMTSIEDEAFDFEGLQLKLWQENGVFLGLAGAAE